MIKAMFVSMWGFKLKVTSKAVLPFDIWLHILVILFYPHVGKSVWRLAQESPKKNYTKEKTATDKRQRRFFHHHHHHVVPLARISLPFSRHFSRIFIASGRSSGLHPVSSHSCCMYVRAGRPAFAWPYAGVHRSTSLMSSSLLLQQCPACLVCLTCLVFVMGVK